MIAVGTIPNKISYVYSAPIKVFSGCPWDIDHYNQTGNIIEIFPTFPVSDENINTLPRAKQWAASYQKHWDSKTQSFIEDDYDVTVDTVDNKPITNVKVVTMEHRGNGGRAYKITIDDKYYLDLREDVLLDTMLQTGILAGGLLQGTFMWAKLGNQLRLIRIGSELHKMLEVSSKKKNLPKLGKKNLEVGGVYQSRKGNKGIFLGYVNTILFSKINYSNFIVKHSPIRKAMLFFDPLRSNCPEQSLSECDIKTKYYMFSIMKSHNFIEKIDTVTIDKDYIELIRKYANIEIKNDILEFTGHKISDPVYGKINKSNLINNLCYHSSWLNVSKYGEPDREPFDIKKYLIFS